MLSVQFILCRVYVYVCICVLFPFCQSIANASCAIKNNNKINRQTKPKLTVIRPERQRSFFIFFFFACSTNGKRIKMYMQRRRKNRTKKGNGRASAFALQQQRATQIQTTPHWKVLECDKELHHDRFFFSFPGDFFLFCRFYFE